MINIICRGVSFTNSSEPRPEQRRSESPQSKWARVHDLISYSNEDLREVRTLHDDPIVVSLTISNYDVKRILVDNGSLIDILFYDAFQKMKLPSKQLQDINAPMVGFIGGLV